MRRAILPLITFMMIIVGIGYYYSRAMDLKAPETALLHDRPVACKTCGSIMWDGPQAHSCAETSREVL